MIALFFAAVAVTQTPAADVGYDQLVAGRTDAAIVVISRDSIETDDPARLLNLGIAYARNGNRQRARELFARAFYSRDWVELETASGTWVDSRTLARQALAMLDAGTFGSPGTLARAAGQ